MEMQIHRPNFSPVSSAQQAHNVSKERVSATHVCKIIQSQLSKAEKRTS